MHLLHLNKDSSRILVCLEMHQWVGTLTVGVGLGVYFLLFTV
jgi:hypothetical protein